MTASLFFVDSRVHNIEHLTSQFSSDTTVIILDPERDGIKQILEILQEYSGLTSIHIISHGGPGSIAVGNTVLDTATLDSYADDLRFIGSGLEEGGDILLYGCNVGVGTEGQEFVERLSDLTGADVAASDDVSGGDAVGGDWELEGRNGRGHQPGERVDIFRCASGAEDRCGQEPEPGRQ